MLTRPLVVTICIMTGIALATVGSTGTAKPDCKTVHGRLDSVAADLDGDPKTLETVGTLRGGIHADFEFRDFSPVPVPSGVNAVDLSCLFQFPLPVGLPFIG